MNNFHHLRGLAKDGGRRGLRAACRAVARLALAALACLAPGPARAGATNPAPDRVVSRFRVGPFFEYRASREGGTFWALRPFWSRVTDPVTRTRVTDVVWPLGTFHRDREQAWWRLLLAYGSDQDVDDDASAWKFTLIPVYCQGRTRAGEDYRALFPIYGHHPHMLLMDDIDFTLFPLYLDYEVNGVERAYWLWPIFSRTGEQPGVSRTGVFPLYGRTRRKESEHAYAFWPFWTSAVYDGPRNPGRSWMLFPLAGRVDREREQQRLVLPPFFSHAQTDAAERWRLPWPFYETVKTPTSSKRSYWPVYGDATSEDERRWSAAWPLIEHVERRAQEQVTTRSRFFPFYVNETVTRADADGGRQELSRYTRVWPFYAREAEPGRSRLRVFEFSLIRHSGGIERNWAPFWTLYERSEEGGEVRHDALWGLFQSRRGLPAAGWGEAQP